MHCSCPSFAGSVCIVHSSVTAPSVCRKNGEALSRPLRGLKYAGLLQSPGKHTEYSTLLWQAGFNSAWASRGGEPVGARPGKWLKLAAMSHQKTSPSTSFSCLCLSLPSVLLHLLPLLLLLLLLLFLLSDAVHNVLVKSNLSSSDSNRRPCRYDHRSATFTV